MPLLWHIHGRNPGPYGQVRASKNRPNRLNFFVDTFSHLFEKTLDAARASHGSEEVNTIIQEKF
jgi:hypothetical protein